MEFYGERVLLLLGIAALGSAIYVVKDECPPNEEYLLCGTDCPANCTSPDPDLSACSSDCVEGCFCESGYLRHENGTCVTSENCGLIPECGENEEFLACGSVCPPTCSQPEPENCDFTCRTGCACKPTFVRDENSGKCIPLEKCPPVPCLNENEVYDVCNAGCEPTCADPEPICTKICAGGCVCAAGLFRNDTECVSVDKCPAGNDTEIGLLAKYLNAINRILLV